jgi:hypothetical protein
MTENMRIWDAVSKTNPAHTKKVNQRGGFTAISAAYQIKAATEMFGPIGIGWGYTTGDPVIMDTLITIPVTLWHGNRENTFGPMWGCEEWKDGKGRVDSDAPKKATTDGLTKLLSQLGFNADVFLGLFDDNKYVASLAREFAEKEKADEPKINDGEWAAITQMIEASPVSVQQVCETYKIASLKDMTVPMFRDAQKRLKTEIQRASQHREAA